MRMGPRAGSDRRRGLLTQPWLPCALLLSAGLSPATAQNLQRTSRASPPDDAGLTEVRVTARRREERLLDVPDSVTALTAASIERSRIQSVKDVAVRVPNFSIVDAQQPGVVNINVRGVGQSRNCEAPVAVVVDGVQLTSSYQITQDVAISPRRDAGGMAGLKRATGSRFTSNRCA